ncbi:MAG: hypothetical protein WAK76_15735, partial [Trebonia sp.]
MPLLHPDGLRPAESLGPADPLRRAVTLRGSLVKRRSVFAAGSTATWNCSTRTGMPLSAATCC